MDLNIENYIEKKYSVSPDLKAYKYNENGHIVEIGYIDVDVLKQIGDYLKEQFHNEANRIANKWSANFIAEYQINYDKKHFHGAEKQTIEQVIRGEKTFIIDSFGITHEVLKYINGLPVIVNDGIKLKLSPVISLDKGVISEIRKYMAFEYNRPKPFHEYIQNLKFHNRYEPYIMAEAFIKYFTFLNEFTEPQQKPIPQLTTNLKTDQITILFESLVKGKFIPDDTDPDSFKWIFGDPKQSRPDQWKPITWNKAKQLLRELLEEIKLDNVTIAEIERIVPILFYKNGTPLKLAKNKITETQDHRKLKKIIANSLTT